MTGDLGSGAGGPPARPSFLPPDERPAPPAAAPPGAADGPGGARTRRGGAADLAIIAVASALLVSAFLPWARARVAGDLLGRPLSRDLGSAAGIDADDLVLAVPVLALMAIGLACWDLLGRDARIGALAAVPALLSLLTCGVFLLRLGHLRDELQGEFRPGAGLEVGYEIGVQYGWYLAIASSVLLLGLSLVRPLVGRGAARDARTGPPGPPEPLPGGAPDQS